MAAASTAALAQQRHVIPIVSVFQAIEDNSVHLSHVVDIGDGLTEKRKFRIPKVSDLDVETICHCILMLPQRAVSTLLQAPCAIATSINVWKMVFVTIGT